MSVVTRTFAFAEGNWPLPPSLACLMAHKEVFMNTVVKVLVIPGFLLAPSWASASLTVTPGLTVDNQCHKDIIIAVRYVDSRGNWATSPFTSIRAKARKNAVVSSNNSIFYYYAESTSGSPSRWSGDQKRRVEGKLYPMKEKSLDLDREGNRYYLKLTCRN
jgi:hypothetical protein